MLLNIVMRFSDHEEADTKLVALGKGYDCSNELLVLSPSGDIYLYHCTIYAALFWK